MKELKEGTSIYLIENALSKEFCDALIAKFEVDNRKKPGMISSAYGEARRDENSKKTMDLFISPLPEWKEEDTAIFQNLGEHLKTFRERATSGGIVHFDSTMDSGYQIQKYEESGMFHWHIDHLFTPSQLRQLVFMYYLNDSVGGETEFLHQNVSITPKAGTLVLFPPFWTHIHRSVPVTKGVKYIVTGWMIATR